MTDTGAMAMRPADTGESKRRQDPRLREYGFTVDVGLVNSIPGTREQAAPFFFLKLGPALQPEGCSVRVHPLLQQIKINPHFKNVF
ncbi:hypothetical protein PPSC2_21880 [Paenibacillus polymyxa SC2]|uniref:Uncharacterized protein n=1 Tax=Paenibacillus polymyxa (strain SC2) TaxID=886882 RepID=E3EBE0_PAEPS|nr:hypothetical protein PPSC2_21880 [Paenibacillus polymyxa SC2]AJE52328.1 hypothetical protein RE92_15365 [Paenibacillus polymyxa]AZH32074.1 hypothetical protein EGM68_22080 [Paenibacillus sp. M-152]QOH63849.1 hypothetical protein DI243_21680 [Paenibacillus polymyxa]